VGFGGCVFGKVFHVFIDLKSVCDWNSTVGGVCSEAIHYVRGFGA